MEENNNINTIEKAENSSETSYLLNIDTDLKKDVRILCAHLDMSLKDFMIKSIKEFVVKKQKELQISEENSNVNND